MLPKAGRADFHASSDDTTLPAVGCRYMDSQSLLRPFQNQPLTLIKSRHVTTRRMTIDELRLHLDYP
jgi:hypothetical protein